MRRSGGVFRAFTSMTRPSETPRPASPWARWSAEAPARSGGEVVAGGHPVTRCQENGPKVVSVVGWLLAPTVSLRYSSGTVLPWTTIRWKFDTSYDGWLFQSS